MKTAIATLLLLLNVAARAAIINAASTSYIDVSNAVSSASLGDTVMIPQGTNWWSKTLNISGITLSGQGTNQTVIQDETSMSSPVALISITMTNTLTRLCNLTISVGVTNNYTNNSFEKYTAIVGVGGTNSSLLRIDHCFFYYLTGKPVLFGNQVNGVIDHCIFQMYHAANAIEVNGTGFGDDSWATPYTYGGPGALFIEDCFIGSVSRFAAIDVSNGGRCVVRNTYFKDTFMNTHGTETGQRYRSARAIEVYNNIFYYGNGVIFDNFYAAIDFRGGSAVIHDNIVTNYYQLATIRDFRSTDNDPGFTPWFGATGLNGYDSNGPVALSGLAGATSNALYVASANWTPNQWVGYTVYNSNAIAGKFVCGVCSANTSNTMTFLTSRTAAYQLFFTNGDPFVVHYVYPQLDMPGRGSGDLMSGGVPAAVWPNQVSEPMYGWSNSVFYNGSSASAALSSGNPLIAPGRDITNAVKPGYTPYTYPHPLTILPPANSFYSGAFKL